MTEEVKPPIKHEDLYKIYRDYVIHEDDLIHQRTTSYVTIQAFTIATFGLSFQKKYEVLSKATTETDSLPSFVAASNELNAIMFFLVLIGISTSYIAWQSIRAASLAIRQLERGWSCFLKQYPCGFLPGLTGAGNSKSSNDGEKFPIYAPLLGLALWLLTLAVLYFAFDIRLKLGGVA